MEKAKIAIISLSILICSIFILFGGLFAASILDPSNPLKPLPNTQSLAQNVTVIIDYSNGSSPIQFDDVEGHNALEVLEEVAIVTFGIWGRLYVVAINGYSGNGWVYYVNENFPGFAAVHYDVQGGSVVKWIAV